MIYKMPAKFIFAVLILYFSSSHVIAADDDIIISAIHFGGGLDVRYDWKIDINGSLIKIERIGKKTHTRKLSAKALDSLRRSIKENDFSDLAGQYGCNACMDNPICRVKMKIGSTSKEVVLYPYFPQVDEYTASPEKNEVLRFMSVWNTIKQIASINSIKNLCP